MGDWVNGRWKNESMDWAIGIIEEWVIGLMMIGLIEEWMIG